MFRRTLISIGIVLALSAPVFAQGQESSAQEPTSAQEREQLERGRAQEREREERARSEAQAQEKEKQEKERREAGVGGSAPGLKGQAMNVRLELTIRDQRESAQPVTKTVSMVVADRSTGRVRTGSTVFTERHGPQPVLVNVDGRPVVLSDGRVLLQLTMEYRPADPIAPRAEGAPLPAVTAQAQAPPHVSETIETIVENGKPLVISRSADPDSDRSVTVEVKATILK
jgi:hypothetical protein